MAWFYTHDLPLIKIDEEVIEVAIDNKLNKSQTKASLEDVFQLLFTSLDVLILLAIICMYR